MSEQHEKPKRKWYKRQPHRFDRLALACLVILVCAVAYIVLWGIKGDVHPSKEGAYGIVKTNLQNAVNDYQNQNNGALPTINGTVIINSSTYWIINICPLLAQNEESLKTITDSLWSGNGSNDDNCDNGCAECTTHGSYIWAVDDEGNVYSTCVGERCNTSGIDGYQDVWP